jgi:predicted metal-dependent hydrolase
MSTSSSYQISIAGIEIDIIRKNIKNMHLAVYPPKGRVRLAVPLDTNEERIRLFAISKLSWIKKNQTKFSKQRREFPREYVTGETHYYFGHRFKMNIIKHQGRSKVVIRNKKYLDLYVKPDSTLEQRERLLREWYRKQLKELVPTLFKKWENIINVKAEDWRIKQMRTKWGTCNIEAKRIWLNLELAKKPIGCIEYIIAHELTHFLERHHNDRFVALMDQFMPDWRECRERLNELPVGG